MNTVAHARAVAEAAHAGQVDKAGRPYMEHVEAVAQYTTYLCAVCNIAEPDVAIIAAYLHDVVEDTPTTLADLAKEGFHDAVLEVVKMLTRDRATGQTYVEWVRSIADSGNLTAIVVKLADNMHNSEPGRVAAMPAHERGIDDRYSRSKAILRRAMWAAVDQRPDRYEQSTRQLTG